MPVPEALDCDTCDWTVPGKEAVRRETTDDLEPTTWQALRCPGCGSRAKPLFVADE